MRPNKLEYDDLSWFQQLMFEIAINRLRNGIQRRI